MYPGLQLQRLTTREPDLDQLAVAIAALLPRAKLIVLPGMGHMLQHAAAGVVADAIDEITSGGPSLAAKP